MDVDARLQLFDLKTKYVFATQPGVDRYNMPLYNLQSETPNAPNSQDIGMYPVYQGFLSPAYVNGIQIPFDTQKSNFFNIWPNVVQTPIVVGIGNGTAGPYTLTMPVLPNNSFPLNPPLSYILRGHVDITGIIDTGVNMDPPFGSTINPLIPSTSIDPAFFLTSLDSQGNNIVVTDSGQFLSINGTKMPSLGLLMAPGTAPYGNAALQNGYISSFVITGATQANPCVLTCAANFLVGQQITITSVVGMTQLNGNTYTVTANSGTTITINVDSTAFTAYASGGIASSVQNVINYFTGVAEQVIFPAAVAAGAEINASYFFFQPGLPRAMLYYNNTITLRSPPGSQYIVELDAYLTPAAFFNTAAAIPFAYMAEYIARGAARKIMSDTGDTDQLNFYEPFFREQEALVWKRSQRQWTSTRTQTIYSQGINQGQSGFNNTGGSTV